MSTQPERSTSGRLHKGDIVRVRSQEEILATLDADGSLGGMPFMPEMLQYAGKEIEVHAPVHKTCDAIGLTGTSRRMERMVHLAGARCDGRAHGGCQAACMLFWREEWLERPSGVPLAHPLTPTPLGSAEAMLSIVAERTHTVNNTGEPVYKCQATEINRASTHVSGFDPRQYVEDLRTKNVRLRTLLAGLAVLAFNKYQTISRRVLPRWLRIRGGLTYPFYQGTGTGKRTPSAELRPGDLVEVRSKPEIMATLGPDSNNNAGLWFDWEQVPVCGRRARVERSVERIIDESTGKMRRLRDCVVLEDVVCTGFYRKFCQRAVPMYWRSAWLRRLSGAEGAAPPG